MSEKLTLFDRFGGTRKMAEILGEPPSTVQSWKRAERVPAGNQPKVLERARECGIRITAEDVIFPMGRDDAAEWPVGSSGNGSEVSGSETTSELEAPSPPFAPGGGSPPTSSSTCPSCAAPATPTSRARSSRGQASAEAEAA